jgi:hypothetical protein
MTRSHSLVTSCTAALGAWALAVVLAVGTGCAAAGSDDGQTSSADDDDTGSGSGSGQGGDGSGITGGTGAGDGAGGGFEHCAQAILEATLVPVNMLIAVDKSGSMLDGDKWGSAEAAFIAFFQAPEADPLRVGLRFWPDTGCDELSCNIAACSQPLVDVGPLSDPAHEQALVNAFASRSPFGLTPMSAALAGATTWAIDYQAMKEGTEKVVVVLVTDGEPTACELSIQAIAKYAADAYAQAGILTFAVGLQGSNESQMHEIAKAGETTQGFFIGSGNAEVELLAALKAIQESTVACSFAMPAPADDDTPIDPGKVNVTFDAQPVKQVSGESACADGGWYYNDPAAPTIIELCDSTCGAIQGEEGAKIEIVLGCTTQIQ